MEEGYDLCMCELCVGSRSVLLRHGGAGVLWGGSSVSRGGISGGSLGVEGSSEGRGSGELEGVGFTTNLQWSGVTSPCVLRPWSKRNQENYLMRSCRGREWGHGVRSLGGGVGRPGGQSRGGRRTARGRGEELGERRVRVQKGEPQSWLVGREP